MFLKDTGKGTKCHELKLIVTVHIEPKMNEIEMTKHKIQVDQSPYGADFSFTGAIFNLAAVKFNTHHFFNLDAEMKQILQSTKSFHLPGG